MHMTDSAENKYQILLYYKYTHVKDPEGFVAWHKELLSKLGIKGRILIAKEGINGTLEGLKADTETYIERMREQDGSEGTFGNFKDMEFKFSPGKADGTSFPKLKVKARKEVVSLGLDRHGEQDLDPNEMTGTHLDPSDLKKWYESGEDFEVIDMRNDYEFKVGHFKNSFNPAMDNFRDLPNVMNKMEHIKEASKKGKKVLTVCTGGIRCEKASGYLVRHGFENVYQLNGGMHKYMEQFPGQDFHGGLYVFDGREVVDFSDGKERPVVGVCDLCKTTTEKYTNCANIECHKKMLCCDGCVKESIDVAEQLIADDTEREELLRNILQVAGSFIFCSEKCKECVDVKRGVKVTV